MRSTRNASRWSPASASRYRFTSSAPVAFNVHFHDSNAIVMPITRDQVTEDSDDFTADRKQTYCLMWEAGAEGALIDYRARQNAPGTMSLASYSSL